METHRAGWPAARPEPGWVRGLALACHPEPTLAVTAAAAGLAVAVGRGPGGALAVVAAVLAGQLSIGWCNDYLDADRDAAVGRRDKPVAARLISRRTVGGAALVALAGCVPLSLLSGALAGTLHVAAVLSAWAYNLGLKATALSFVPYAVSFGLLPAFVVLGKPGHPAPPLWLLATGSLLGVGAHFANVLPDIDADERTGVRGLPHRLGPAASRAVSGLFLLSGAGVLAVGPHGRPDLLGYAGIAVAAGALLVGSRRARRDDSRAAFRAVLLVAVVAVGLLLVRGAGLR